MTQPIDPTLLERLKALHEKATPEPWNTEHYGTFVSGPVISDDWDWIVVSGDSLNDEDDFGERLIPNNEFIAALRNALPQLLAHIEAQDKRVSAMVEALEAARAGLHSVCVFEAEERIDESDLGEIEIHHNTECKAASAALVEKGT